MKKITINRELTLTYTDEFHKMSAFRANDKFYVIQYISRSEYNAQNRVAYADALHSLKLSA